jgi:hypothetical protein|tara:strand:+ start:929 stop:1225 length:297 start_codon:yes stop_codon:yes gene_type:complete
MATIKLTEEPKEVYFKNTTNYKLEVDGKPLTICIEEDSNESILHYIDEKGATINGTPDWILEMGEDDWGELIFERTLYENISGLQVNEEIYTHEDDKL